MFHLAQSTTTTTGSNLFLALFSFTDNVQQFFKEIKIKKRHFSLIIIIYIIELAIQLPRLVVLDDKHLGIDRKHVFR